MAKFSRGKNLKNWRSQKPSAKTGKLRIVGGQFRGRQITYSGDPVTRPMKDDIREAVFNLIGGWVPGRAVFDLFSGTGAMGLEAISRGASQAFLIERHFPTIRIIRENVQSLGQDLPVNIVAEDTFFWVRHFLEDTDQLPAEPWLVFCCPPYEMFLSDAGQLMDMLVSLMQSAPPNSLFVVESDERFNTELLPRSDQWFSRQYAPALISIYRESKGQNADPLSTEGSLPGTPQADL